MPGARLYDHKSTLQTIGRDYSFLIPILESRKMNSREILLELEKAGVPNATHNTVRLALDVLSKTTMLYMDDDRPANYKILTRKEEDDYSKKHTKNIIGEQYEWK